MTIASFAHPYCTRELFIERYDVRTVGDYLSDTDKRLTPTEVINSTILLDLMMQASGTVESFVLRGQRYSVADLQELASMNDLGQVVGSPTNTSNMLYGIVCGLTMFYLWNRRPAKYSKDEMPAGCQEAWANCEALGNGLQIFGIAEVAAAPNAEPEFMTPTEIYRRNFSSNQAQRFFGRRAQFNVPGYGE